METRPTHIQITFSPQGEEEIQRIMNETGSTRVEVLNSALSLFQWAIRKTRLDETVASVNPEDNSYKPVVIPGVLEQSTSS
jgi:hypothetical protein